jgi:hypothetical protein
MVDLKHTIISTRTGKLVYYIKVIEVLYQGLNIQLLLTTIYICSVYIGLHTFLMVSTLGALREVRGKERPAFYTPPA